MGTKNPQLDKETLVNDVNRPRSKATDCRKCIFPFENLKADAVKCTACSWYVHITCTDLTPDQLPYAQQNGPLKFTCSLCDDKLAKRTDKWLVFDTEKQLRLFEKQMKQAKLDFEKKLKDQKITMEHQAEAVSDIQRRVTRQVETNEKLQEELSNRQGTSSEAKYQQINEKYLEATATHEKVKNDWEKEKTELQNTIAKLKQQLQVGGANVQQMPTNNISDESNAQTKRPTFAEVIRRSAVPPERTRKVKCTENNSQKMDELLANSEQLKQNGIISFNKRNDNALIIQFENVESANKFESETIRSIGTDLVISTIPSYQPEMKIVGINDMLTPMVEIIASICAQNDIDPLHIQLVREYTIDVTRRIYRNAIIKCSIDVLTKFVANGAALNGRNYRCFEQEKVLQCFQCYSFGHVASRCVNKVTCRKCAGNHTSDVCTDTTTKYQCINCRTAGKPFEHKVVSESCPQRFNYVNRRIDFLEKKSSNRT